MAPGCSHCHSRPRRATLLADPDTPLATESPEPGLLRIQVPTAMPTPHAAVIKLVYQGRLKADRFEPVIRPAADGSFELSGNQARTTGPLLHVVNEDAIQYWTGKDHAEWTVESDAPADYSVELVLSCDAGRHGTPIEVSIGPATFTTTIPDTGGRPNYKTLRLGRATLPAGRTTVRVATTADPPGTAMNLRRVRLVPVK